MTGSFGTIGPPPDAAAVIALVVAFSSIVLVVAGRRSPAVARTLVAKRRVVVACFALTAAALSSAYVVHYLRGGPRIIDATSYFLEARALATQGFSFQVPEPTASFRGRFLYPSGEQSLSVIFPPGYPAYLAVGFVLGAPLFMGPLLAAALVIATYVLARRLFEDPRIALCAAGFSVLSATLRYHTADTMSHGLAALLSVVSIGAVLSPGRGAAVVAGLASGWLVATRPVTGAVITIASLVLMRASPKRWASFLPALVPGVVLLLWYQHAVTGSAFASVQRAYYAIADAPAECFRYGFGEGVGCRLEHGDFVRANLPDGYGFVEAAKTTLRRLKMHLPDAANVEIFFVVLVWTSIAKRRVPSVNRLTAIVVSIVLAYTPFYFDGNYPGGGARFFADALPFEHVLLAYGVLALRLQAVAPALSLAGFAFHTAYEHGKLRDREGGRPMFEPDVVARHDVRRGLVFVETDHGFNLGFEPGRSANDGIVVARLRNDAHDAWLHASLGAPRAFRYDYALDGSRPPRLVPYAPLPLTHFEAEAEWPPSVVLGGALRLEFSPCASGGRGLKAESQSGSARFAVNLLARKSGTYIVTFSFFGRPTGAPVLHRPGESVRLHPAAASTSTRGCGFNWSGTVSLNRGSNSLLLEVEQGTPAVDFWELTVTTPMVSVSQGDGSGVGPGTAPMRVPK